LFGALLGTLSQSSTTTAQKRRADIEKKQLGKLQQRDEELEEEKRRTREKFDVIRKKEQKVWDEQSVWFLLTAARANTDGVTRCEYDTGICWLRRIS
jgi:pinin/SDK/memA/ protein conserved region